MRRSPALLLLLAALGSLPAITSLQLKSNDDHPICVTADGSELCFNGGHCVAEDGDVRCQCLTDFFGSRCERRKCPVFNPCHNGGLCEKTADSFACHCPLGFEGRYCLNRVSTICDTRPCGHGRCTVTHSVHEYTCQCHYGYTGANCTEVDHCLEALCLHGECVNGPSAGRAGHVCVCERGWTGAACDVDIDGCAAPNAPCANGATCVNTQGDYVCKCPSGFGGRHCELTDDGSACRAELCLNGGQCVAADAPPPPTSPAAAARRVSIWRRFNAFFDDYDDDKLTATTNSSDKIGWRCDCAPGFYGAHCEVRVDECALNDFALAVLRDDTTGSNNRDRAERGSDDAWWEYAMCINGGVCVGRGGSTDESIVLEAARAGLTAHALGAVCKCPAGFTGEHCERDLDECALSVEPDGTSGLCANGGQCVNTFGGYRCTCAGGFSGDHCETNVDDCVDNICHPGSTCVDGVARYDCICELDQIGMLCEHENPCYGDRNPCSHGQCYPNHMYGNYTCACDSGFTGVNCEADVDECALDPNLCGRYGGSCTNTVGGYRCEHAPNCSLGLCQNDAYCLDYDNNYECICLPGFAGRHCEIRTAPLPPIAVCALRCANGGACRRDSAGSADVCECTPNYTGPLCEQRIVKDAISPTRDYTLVEPSPREADCRVTACRNNGTCTAPAENTSSAADTRHVCSCLPGFAGAFCELDVNECLATPCQNQGRCVDLINGFRCDCAPGFAGERCEVNVDDCANVICLHGGRCRDGVNSFRCECADGYAGAYCEVDLHAYERADDAQRRRCVATGCAAKAQNGRCDAECNFYACDYDGGDCALQNARPFERCGGALRSYCAHAFGNGRCDEACNVEDCLFDGFDCVDSSLSPANSSSSTPTPLTTPSPASPDNPLILGGELSLVILGQPAEFFRVAPRFLVQLSTHLRASLRVSEDVQGRARIYAWQSDTGADENTPLALPVGWTVGRHLRVDYINLEDGQMAQRSRRDAISRLDNSSELQNVTILFGVKMYLRVDVTVCMSLTQGRDCFSDLESASQYLSADSAKRRLDDLNGVQIYSAEAIVMKPAAGGSKNVTLIISGGILIICAIATLFAPRRRKAIKAAIWHPKPIIKKHHKSIGAIGINGYHDLVNSATSTQYSNLSNTTSSNRSLAMTTNNNNNNNNHNNNLNMNNVEILEDRLAPYAMFSSNFGDSLDRIQSGQDHINLNGLYATIGASGPHDIRTDYGIAPQTSKTAIGSYSSSSGVSSGQTSPNDRSDFDSGHANGVAEMSPALCALHTQATSALGIREPIDLAVIDARDPAGRTALHVLMDSGVETHVIADSINRLLAAGADLNAQDNQGNTPLILAVKRERADVVALLIERGADVNRMDVEERAPLHHAIYAPQAPEVFRQLLAAAELDLNVLERRRWSPLAVCASLTHCPTALDFARLLAEHGADVNRAGERDAVFDESEEHFSAPTPLHVAAATNNVAMIRLLVTNKANKDAKDAQERSPLCIAALNGNMEAVRELLTLGAEKDQPDGNDQTAAQLALAANFKEIAAHIEISKPNRSNISPLSQQSRNGCGGRASTMAAQPRAGAKRVRNSPTAGRKDSVKSYKAKRSTPNGAASNLMALTPPNSDQSTYSTTPSPSNTIGAAGPTIPPVSSGGYSRPTAGVPNNGYSTGYEPYAGLRMPLTLMSDFPSVSQDSRLPYPHRAPWAAASAECKSNGPSAGFSASATQLPVSVAAYDTLSPPTVCDRLPYLPDTELLLLYHRDGNNKFAPSQQQFNQQQYRMAYGSQMSLTTYGHYDGQNANATNVQF